MKIGILFLLGSIAAAQEAHQHPAAPSIALQPLAQQVRQLEDALAYLGQPLPPADHKRINDAIANTDAAAAVTQLQAVLDQYVLVNVDINPESRVKVEQGAAKPELVEAGTRLFLVKVINNAHVTAQLNVESPNSGNVWVKSSGSPAPPIQLTPRDSAERWADISLHRRPPKRPRLSGLALEYSILEVHSRDAGQRSAKLSFNVGQGSQDIGFRNDMTVLFTALPARKITLRVKDENGRPSMASFQIRDRLDRLYPNPAKRLAPDFFFQPQIYRADGETVQLPNGYYTVQYSGGPEYLTHTREFANDAGGPGEVAFQLERWIDPSKYGWYSGDHHIHAAGCSHYMNPTEGVEPKDMIRQILGEHLNLASVLTWGPDYYYQKQFFSGKDHPLSKPGQLMHYDLEVSGFPSSHAGHIVLLNLRQQDYPGTKKIEDWPTWDLPIFRWAKSQGAVVGFAHSGWGLQVSGKELPSYEMPSFDGIGANEYIVDVTHPDSVDFISAVDTPYVWELNIWYHTLNGTGTGGDVRLNGPANVSVTVSAAAFLPVKPNEAIRSRPLDDKPYWDVERARVGDSRVVPVEIVVNGKSVAKQMMVADGTIHELKFDVPVKESSWIAARVLPSAHTNPVFAMVGAKPIRASRASAEWCLNAVNQCWTQKAPRISAAEQADARKAYDHAREVYRQLIRESAPE